MKTLKGKVAVVTGAASGIGEAISVSLSGEGCRLAIGDINGEDLESTARFVKKRGTEVSTHVVDVSRREEVYTFADEVVETHGSVHLVINNAGVTLVETVEDMTFSQNLKAPFQ